MTLMHIYQCTHISPMVVEPVIKDTCLLLKSNLASSIPFKDTSTNHLSLSCP